jgi:hypothetical protein
MTRTTEERRVFYCFLAILVCGTLLRMNGLTSLPLIEDAFYTIRDATTFSSSAWRRPLYFLLQSGVFQIMDVSPLSLRILPFLFGVATIWLIWRAGLSVGGPITGLGAATLVAFSPWHIHVSQIGRYWSLVSLEAVIFFWALANARATGRRAAYLAAAGAGLAGIFTHPTFLFLLPGALLVLGLETSGRSLRFDWNRISHARSLVVSMTLLAAAALVFLWLTRRNLPLGIAQLAQFDRFLPAIVEWTGPTVSVACGLAVLYLVLLSANERLRWWGLLTVAVSVGHILLLLAAGRWLRVYAYYAIALLPLGFVAVGLAVDSATRALAPRERGFAVFSLLGLLVASLAPSIVSNAFDGTRFDYRPAYRFIEENGVDFAVYGTPAVMASYYSPRLDFHEIPMDPGQLSAAKAANGAFWVIASYRRYGLLNDPGGAVDRWLDGNCYVELEYETRRFDYRRYAVVVYWCADRRRRGS